MRREKRKWKRCTPDREVRPHGRMANATVPVREMDLRLLTKFLDVDRDLRKAFFSCRPCCLSLESIILGRRETGEERNFCGDRKADDLIFLCIGDYENYVCVYVSMHLCS